MLAALSPQFQYHYRRDVAATALVSSAHLRGETVFFLEVIPCLHRHSTLIPSIPPRTPITTPMLNCHERACSITHERLQAILSPSPQQHALLGTTHGAPYPYRTRT